LGNRRVVFGVVLAASCAVALSGCTADSTFESTNGEAVAIGQQAIGFTSSGGSSAGWTSPIACPQAFEDGLRSSTPTTATIQKIDPTTVTGPIADPNLTTGYVATCVYRLTTSTNSVLELAFLDIDDTHSAVIPTKLVADGFVSQGATQSTDAAGHQYSQTIYSNGTARVVVATLTIDSIPALLVAG
jgi:hypothetical protein